MFRPQHRPPGNISERTVDKFSSFFFLSGNALKHCFSDFGGVLVLFSDSLALFTSIASFFVPKDPNGSGNGPKQNFKKNLKTCLRRAGLISLTLVFLDFWMKYWGNTKQMKKNTQEYKEQTKNTKHLAPGLIFYSF